MINNRYELLEEIGSGGSATLYRAKDVVEERDVALKRYHPSIDCDNFDREKRVLQGLDHPAFPSYIDDFVSDDEFGETKTLVMDYVEGDTLAEHIERGYNFSSAELKDILLQGLDALEYLHTTKGRPIIHRDIKPENIKITDKGLVKFLDFGIVTDEMARTLGRTGFLGTVWYVAPEQFQGFAEEKSDVYSFGRTLFRAIVGDEYKREELDFSVLEGRNLHPNLISAVEGMTQEDIRQRRDVNGVREILEKQNLPAVVEMEIQKRSMKLHKNTIKVISGFCMKLAINSAYTYLFLPSHFKTREVFPKKSFRFRANNEVPIQWTGLAASVVSTIFGATMGQINPLLYLLVIPGVTNSIDLLRVRYNIIHKEVNDLDSK